MNKASLSNSDLQLMNPKEFRDIIRRGEWTQTTLQACRGYAQANLAIVPKEVAFEFLLFCQRNPQATPLIDVTEPGDPHPKLLAPQADLRSDLPRYRVYKNGNIIDEPIDIHKYWRDDLVAFLIGCSGSFDWALQAANIPFRLTGGLYTSNIPCVPAGRFHGPMAVGCRLVKGSYASVRTIQISSRYIAFHGPPVHIGDPAIIGIKDFYHPDLFIDEPIAAQEPDEIPMFWGCGVTPQMLAIQAKLPLMIGHFPACMFVTDRLSEELAIL